MARRPLLTDEERQLLFGVPGDPDALARHYIFTRSDQDLVVGRRGAANRLGFAVQLALLRHPGIGLAQMESRSTPLSSGWRRSWIFRPPPSPLTPTGRRP